MNALNPTQPTPPPMSAFTRELFESAREATREAALRFAKAKEQGNLIPPSDAKRPYANAD
jgi:hypothetical protein